MKEKTKNSQYDEKIGLKPLTKKKASEKLHYVSVGHKPQKSNQSVSKKELGGPKGPEPTRYGDWERNGRCIDF
ncbi:MAG: hypothetical protein CFH42_00880 [Alphaproteobacteria bacterium MarineAlpha12_Bin1]|jgi:hypothetical protein|nr:MAG: hypothetical protein CFH42_00880 [Alphaproteobacteria bacterium MarineAlpha12_Bin1]|tara:strand:+ start:11545 stop:11763 length:219 start_codon:yes stop_codon:yes gene_type:complete